MNPLSLPKHLKCGKKEVRYDEKKKTLYDLRLSTGMHPGLLLLCATNLL